MNEPIREQLSALMDGELEADQARFLLARAEGDPDVARRWARYQFAAQVLRREHPVLLREGFAESVLASIAAPAPALAVRPRMAQRMLRWGTGGAIAASVAVAALMATRPAGDSPAAPPQTAFARATPVAAGPAIAVAPAAATTTSFGPGEVRPPLLAPLDAAPASYGMETLLVPSLDPRSGMYARHAQPAAAAPYVLLVEPAQAASRDR